MEPSRARAGGNVVPDCRRIRDFRHLCCRLYFLHRQEPERAAAATGAACSGLPYRLLAFEQPDHHLAARLLKAGKLSSFSWWWLLTLVLGAIFLGGTFREWHHLIYDEGLTIQTNLFGTTYYSLVGLHAFHVTVGLLALATVSLFALLGKVTAEHAERVEVLAMYWHFVDSVWVVVFTVVYIVGR